MKVELSEVTNARNFFSSHDDLTTDATESTGMKRLVDSLASSSQIGGPAWDQVRESLNTYSSALEARINLATNMGEIITGVLDDIIEYLTTDDGNGTYSSLDPGSIPALEEELRKMDRNIEALKRYKETLYIEQKTTDEDGNEVVYKMKDLEGRQRVQDDIDAVLEDREIFQKLLNKINGYVELYNDCIGRLDSITADISEFENAYSNIIEGQSVLYDDYSY